MTLSKQAILFITPQRCSRCGFSWTHSQLHLAAFSGTHLGAPITQADFNLNNYTIWATETSSYTASHPCCYRCPEVLTLPDWRAVLQAAQPARSPARHPAPRDYANMDLDDLFKME